MHAHTFIFLLLITLFATHQPANAADDLYGRVVGVTDGDTITVLDSGNRQHEIRLFAIDSPETGCHLKKPSAYDDECIERSQPFGKSAKRSLSDLVYGKDVKVVLQPGSTYGREIGTIWVNGIDANYEQVRRGMAWHYKHYAAKSQTRAEFASYEQAENAARANQNGLWSARNAEAPWEYRRGQR